MNQFDDIRPFRDDEVPTVIQRLIDDDELIDLLLSRRVPLITKLIPRLFVPALRSLAKRCLRKRTSDVNTVADFQSHIAVVLKDVLAKTSDGYSFSGLDRVDPNKTYLFLCNHRDIAMDAAMVNLALHSTGLDTVRIAIGDNLLRKPFATDLMRVNRSFIVKRSIKRRREKMMALKTLSNYIRHSIVSDSVSCWIAQAEGRAKDGYDRTETALLKMLSLSKADGQDFSASMASLNIMPVAVSYEYDPCDTEKAKELYALQQGMVYIKENDEDLNSMIKGFLGYKGRIHVSFGDPVIADCGNAEGLATEIDRQIHNLYRLFPSNIIAWQIQNGENHNAIHSLKGQWPQEDWSKAESHFQSRIDAIPSLYRSIALGSYMKPVDSQLAYQKTPLSS